MQLDHAIAIAERVKAQLAPHCDRIAIAGSIRRRKPDVGDIEIVCIPKRTAAGHRSVAWVIAVIGAGRPMKGDPRIARYVQFQTRGGDGPIINVDIFTATPQNWGLIYAIRTGSADFSHWTLACGWVRNGYKSVGGMLSRAGAAVPVREERDLFRLAGVPWVEPEARNLHGPNNPLFVKDPTP
jgi:DNA polymerase/3'-5' exonuclease PolX